MLKTCLSSLPLVNVSFCELTKYHKKKTFELAVVFKLDAHTLFCKKKLYENTQDEICPKIKTRLRTITTPPGWIFDPTNLTILFNPCTQIEICM